MCTGMGDSFDIVSGAARRAPKLFRTTGTEFLFRFVMEPRKRLSHQATLLRFLFRVIRMRVSEAT